MKEIKLLATDMDGTLLNDNKEISRYNLRALRKLHQQGVEIVVCSGRNYTGVISYLKEIGEDIVNHIVFCNGAGIYDVKKDRVIKKQLLNEEFVQLAVKLGNRLEIPCTWINGKMVKTTVNPIPRYLLQEAYLTDMDLEVITEINEHHTDEVFKITYAAEPDKIQLINELFPDDLREKYNAVTSGQNYFEVSSKKATKAGGISYLLKNMNLKWKNVCAIGDQQNDLSMLIKAGESVAMGNAIEEVKNASTHITDINNKAGFAKAMVEIFGLGNLYEGCFNTHIG